jgi:hypothetical protein
LRRLSAPVSVSPAPSFAEQEMHDGHVTSLRGVHKRRTVLLVVGVHVRPSRHQALHGREIIGRCCMKQRAI